MKQFAEKLSVRHVVLNNLRNGSWIALIVGAPNKLFCKKTVLQCVFCWENWSSFMCSWQDEIHCWETFFGNFFGKWALSPRSGKNFFVELWTIFENLLKLWMFMMKRTKITHVMQLAGKNISTIFLGVNTF